MPALEELKARLVELAHLKSTIAVLNWDAEVYMPTGAINSRSQTLSYLSQLLHDKFLDKEFVKILKQASKQKSLSEHDEALIREVQREFKREKKLPSEFVATLAETTSKSSHVWAKARKESDFKIFQPYLKKIVDLKRREADYVGFKKSPYDALLDSFEPGFTAEEAWQILEEVKDFLVPLLKKIKASTVKIDPQIIHGHFDITKQHEFNQRITKKIGFDYDLGRLDRSTHPFTTGFHPHDVRITTRYYEEDVLSALMSSMHEAGHGLYEQGLSHDHFGTPLGESASLGIHESQSRLWENMVGRSKPFWDYLYPQVQAEFPKPFKKVVLKDFYQVLNMVNPALIRVEADEVTYNLHVIIRFEIEKELIEGSISVKDLPEIWNSKIKDYLGVDVPDDAHGVLQDIHWSSGLFGYFPTYTLGTLYAAQLYAAAKQQLPQLEGDIARGEFSSLREWLRSHIHLHGKRYPAAELMQSATGQPISTQPYRDYITNKYSQLYKIT